MNLKSWIHPHSWFLEHAIPEKSYTLNLVRERVDLVDKEGTAPHSRLCRGSNRRGGRSSGRRARDNCQKPSRGVCRIGGEIEVKLSWSCDMERDSLQLWWACRKTGVAFAAAWRSSMCCGTKKRNPGVGEMKGGDGSWEFYIWFFYLFYTSNFIKGI